MNRASSRMIARDPVISSSGLRFLLIANVTAREFLAGFQTRAHGESLTLSPLSTRRLPVARKAKLHGGCGDFHSSRSGKVMLTYNTDRFRYTEEHIHDGSGRGTPTVRLTVWNAQLPEVIVAALPGRRLIDLIGADDHLFLTAKTTRIVGAATREYRSGSTNLHLDLGVRWHPLQRVLGRSAER